MLTELIKIILGKNTQVEEFLVDSTTDQNAFYKGDEYLSFQQTVDHLSKAYSNAQSAARFLDTKASAIIAATTTLVALALGLSKWILELLPRYAEATNHWNGIWFSIPWLALVCLVLLCLFSGKAVIHAFKCLVPRDPKKSAFTALFPYIDPSKKLPEDAVRCFDRFEQGAKCKQVVREYRVQLIRMGEINHDKINHSKEAIKFLKWLPWILLAYAVLNMSVFFVINW